MKAILISIQPKWVEKILNGKKTIEIRKAAPKCELPIDVYIYCTKNKDAYFLRKTDSGYKQLKSKVYTCREQRDPDDLTSFGVLNGKVVAKFTLNRFEDLPLFMLQPSNSYENDLLEKVAKQSCLSADGLRQYSKAMDYHKSLYLWHIFDLQVFDKPRELGDFKKWFEYIQKNLDKGIGCHSGECDAELNWHCAVDCYGHSYDEVEIKRPPQSWQFVEVAG